MRDFVPGQGQLFPTTAVFGYNPRMRSALSAFALLALLGGCARAPSPLAPHFSGSIGLPSRGVLTQPEELPSVGVGYRTLSSNGRRYGTSRTVAVIAQAAAKVAAERPNSVLTVGDLSAKTGGHISSHASHRTGRDADLLLYMSTLEGVPVTSTSFVSVGPDGLAWDEPNRRFVRFDVEREWLLIKALVEDPDARVQWLFVSRPIEALLLEWAVARGEPLETIVRAMDAMHQPGPPAQSHDDHIHLRVACDPQEIASGCEPTGPSRPWVEAIDRTHLRASAPPTTLELVASILAPMTSRHSVIAGSSTGGPADAASRP